MGGVAHVDAGISSSRSRGSISSLEQPRARFKPSKITARERASWPPSPASTILRLPACLPACLPAATLRMGRCLGQGERGEGAQHLVPIHTPGRRGEEGGGRGGGGSKFPSHSYSHTPSSITSDYERCPKIQPHVFAHNHPFNTSGREPPPCARPPGDVPIHRRC